MKALIINQSDIAGGAAIAGFRLHQGLLNSGVHSRMLVGIKKTQEETVDIVPRKYRLANQVRRVSSIWGLNHVHNVGSFFIPQHRYFREADILNFHNLHSGSLNYLAIPQLTAKKPAVLTLHDMWGFTGHCSYSYDCQKWQLGCGNCPYLDTYPAIDKDSSRLEWKLKSWIYNHSNLTIVAPSTWLAQQAKKSILGHLPLHLIPYGLDTDKFTPLGTRECREKLGIPAEKKVLMFAAANFSETRKGGDLLLRALQALPETLKPNLVLLTIGNSEGTELENLSIQHINLGYLTSETDKTIAYSAADLFVFPTRADNLPLVLQESMACGTPLISFDVGGVPDMVRPGVTGYLAHPEDVTDLCNGIIQILEDDEMLAQMKLNCRSIAVNEYSLQTQADKYKKLFAEILEEKVALSCVG